MVYRGEREIGELQLKHEELSLKFGFTKQEIYKMDERGENYSAWAFISHKRGQSIWVISGIHGEETAGPLAIADGIQLIAQIAEEIPVVVMPLLNPFGMDRDWRYFNEPRDYNKGSSVGDMSHVMIDFLTGKKWAEKPENRYAEALAIASASIANTHSPQVMFDHHEDEMASGGYIYPLGSNQDEEMAEMILLKMSQFLPITDREKTRFGEEIMGGVVKAEPSSSFDDFIVQNLRAKAAFTIETPTWPSIGIRVQAHLAVMKCYKQIFELTS